MPLKYQMGNVIFHLVQLFTSKLNWGFLRNVLNLSIWGIYNFKLLCLLFRIFPQYFYTKVRLNFGVFPKILAIFGAQIYMFSSLFSEISDPRKFNFFQKNIRFKKNKKCVVVSKDIQCGEVRRKAKSDQCLVLEGQDDSCWNTAEKFPRKWWESRETYIPYGVSCNPDRYFSEVSFETTKRNGPVRWEKQTRTVFRDVGNRRRK